ncbi:cell wall-active antibiotics response protein LiaF [Lactococcus cremoris]|uniref:cell wall-active antibiotics response protein LiaF n=1 Tax=Lactococcus lactis subsp. cremoris TaxID=1359 RepID=UPI002FCA3225
MNKKLKAIFIIEIFIVLGLIFHVISTPRMWVVLALAILFTILATRSRARVLRIISFIFWAISVMILFTVGWFWLAIVFPAIVCIIFWKNNPREGEGRSFSYEDISQYESESVMNENQNDIIDLDDVTFKPSGNSLSIKKMTGNTKIIVPDDVGVALDLTTNAGLVKIFNEAAQSNAGNIHYFSDNLDQAEKRIKINIRVDSGNIEVIRG